MRRRSRTVVALLAALAALAASALGTAPALGASTPALTDCIAHGALSKHYPLPQLKQALARMSASTKEYSDCVDVINRAIAADVSGKGGTGSPGGGGSGSFLPTPVIVILVILVLAAATFGGIAIRRRRDGDGDPGGGGGP
jgi:hypothetical protein